jgi:hypothetical protein
MQRFIARWTLIALIFISIHYFAASERQPASEYHARRVALAAKLGGGAALIFGANEPGMEYDPGGKTKISII